MINIRTLWDRVRGLAAAIVCTGLLGVVLAPREPPLTLPTERLW